MSDKYVGKTFKRYINENNDNNKIFKDLLL